MKTCKRGHARADIETHCQDCKRERTADRRRQDPAFFSKYPREQRRRQPEHVRERERQVDQRLWAQFFERYGRMCVGTDEGKPCEWSVSNPKALTIGHLNNDGWKHRERLNKNIRNKRGAGGRKTLYDLKRRNWPTDEGIAPQCANCQLLDSRKNAGLKYQRLSAPAPCDNSDASHLAHFGLDRPDGTSKPAAAIFAGDTR